MELGQDQRVGGEVRTNLDLAFHSLTIFISTSLFDHIVLLEGSFEAILQSGDLSLAYVEVRVPLLTSFVGFVELGDTISEGIGEI